MNFNTESYTFCPKSHTQTPPLSGSHAQFSSICEGASTAPPHIRTWSAAGLYEVTLDACAREHCEAGPRADLVHHVAELVHGWYWAAPNTNHMLVE